MSAQAAAPGGTGAQLGTQLLRYSGIHTVGVVVSNVLTFGSTILIANFIDPGEFGQLGLLLFLAGLMTLAFTVAAKQGTMKRTFGGDDDDDDDDDADGELSTDPRKTLGTGLILIGLVSTLGTVLTVVFAEPISAALLGDGANQSLVVWAAVAGGTGALFRVASITIWLERRPYPYIAVEAMRPLITLVAVVPLLVGGAGLEGAIAGTALGSALGTAFALVLLRGSWLPTFSIAEAAAIYRKGAIRVPLVTSMWVVGYADIFILSRFVSDADLGVYLLASRAGFLVSFLPAGYRKALRPLMKTTTFRAVEDEYGVGTARGIQFGYFVLMLTFVMLAVTVLANALVRVAPPAYADAAPLIPLLSLGLVAPTAYRMLNKSVKYANKRYPFIAGAVVAAVLFVGLAIVLVDRIGVEGAPLAMIGGFTPPALFIFWRSQRGRSPIRMPYRSMLTAIGLAVGLAFLHASVSFGGIVVEAIVGLAAVGIWVVLVALTGAIPVYHRAALVQMVRSLYGRGRGESFDPVLALAALPRGERRALRRAILGRKAPERACEGLVEADSGAEAARLVGILRHAIRGGGGADGLVSLRKGAAQRDQQIGLFLFATGPIAGRDQIGKSLLNDGLIEAGELNIFERAIAELRATPRSVWKKPGKNLAADAPARPTQPPR